MIIEDPDAFKTWLTAVLKPICDADPEALAKYVIALVKKDKSADALHQSMVSQLQVFLQDETKPFVDQLFRTLENQAYVSTPTIPNTNPPNPQLSKAEIPTKAAINKPIIPVAEIAAISETLNGKGVTPLVKEEKPPRRRSRRRSLSRGRSRSRSWDRNRRSRSRDKKPVRGWRNKSPWRHERRRSASPSGRIRSRSRSPRHGYRGGGRYRNRSPPRSHSRSRSPGAKERDDSGNGTPTAQPERENHEVGEVKPGQLPGGGAGTQEARKRRCRDYDEEGYCMRGGMCPYDHGVDAVVLEDAALSRVLYPNGANDGLLGPPPPTVPPHMMHPRPAMSAEYNPQAPQMWHQRGPGGGFRGGHRGGMNQGPRARMPMGPFQGGPQIPPLPNMQRELISVPVLGTEMPPMEKYGFNPQPPSGPPSYHPENMFKKKQFDFNRLGPRQKNPSNCSLELKKVPTGLNNITHLNNHFAKFGKIVNIQVSFEGDPEAAIVTFSSHAEANAAYRSTEAVLNNRFIKVFWHSGTTSGAGDAKDNQLPAAVVRSVKERLGQGGNVPPNANKFLNMANQVKSDADKEKENTQVNNTEADEELRAKEAESRKAQQTLAIKKKQELLAVKEKLKKSQEEKRKEALKLTQDLRKRKQDLLEKQIAQQKLLIEKMGKCPPGAQRDLLLQTIKKSQESIEVIRKDVAKAVLTMKTAAPALKRSKEAVQKELLDAELDLISKQAEGVDTTDLQKKLWELKARAGVGVTPQVVPVRGRGRGARRFNPLGRHKLVKNNFTPEGVLLSPTKAHAVDHRPTRLLVSGYEGDDQENVLAHFRQFGDIVDFVSDDALPSVIVNYKTRKEAEIAFNKGKHFQDRTLSVTWYNQAQIQRQQSRTVLISESDEDQLIDTVAMLDGDDDIGQELSEDVLLQDDEEEEEESEDRSWRR